MFALASCASGGATVADPADFDPVDWTGGKGDISGVPAMFDHNNVMVDSLFTAAAVDGNAVQQFLENTPYGTRSWLADAQLDGMRFSDDVVQIAKQGGIDPVLLLARMQVESSLVSATVAPSKSKLASALGCACPDTSGCSSASAGLSNQLHCAVDVLQTQFTGSQGGTGNWNLNKTRTTGDNVRVTPHTNATAALYAYTPWVLVGQGGNWLNWNVMRKYLKAFDAAGTLRLP